MNLKMKLYAFLTLFALFKLNSVQGHSWLACTDYAEKNAGSWNANKCRGFPRMAHIKVNKDRTFGGDNGYDHRPSDSNACNFPYTDNAYTADHPMAVYYPGQQVVLVHPMKNHGADGACGTIWMPDTGSSLYAVQARSGSSDPTLSQFKNHKVFDLGRSPSGNDFGGNFGLGSVYPKPGYANAPNFCDNTDKALATFSFNVPRNMQPGVYSFVWLWSFNSANDLYSTCFEVEVVRNKRARDESLRVAGFNDLTEPCGGVTSNPDIMGNSNPGCTRSTQNGPSEYSVVPGRTTPPPSTTTTTTDATTENYYRSTQSTEDYNYVQTERTSYTQAPTQPPFVYTDSPTVNTDLPDVYYPDGNEETGYESDSRRPPNLSNIRLSIPIHMRSTQFSGEMWLPVARDNTIRRYISVDFTCGVEIASFWNCRTISDPEESRLTNHYDLVQRGTLELETNYIFYHVSFQQPCDLSVHAPIARLVQEDLL